MNPLINVEDVAAVLRADFEEGKLFWLPRPRWAFSSGRAYQSFCSLYAGKEALTAVTSNGYKIGVICGERARAHRVIWALFNERWPLGDVDHIDGDRLNNAINNLRECSRSQNLCNKGAQSNNSTGYKGVKADKRRGTYSASIGMNGGCRYLGRFKTAEEAAVAYDEAAISLHGEFAKVNFRDRAALEARVAGC